MEESYVAGPQVAVVPGSIVHKPRAKLPQVNSGLFQ